MLKTIAFLLILPLIFAASSPELVHFKLFGTDRIQVLPSKQGTDDIFHNFAFLFPSEEISNYLVADGVGTFMNISYANLYLRVSVDHSFLFLVSDYCKNCDRNILFNISHSLTGELYSFENAECWSNSFTTNQYNIPQCEIKLNYGNDNIVGLLGYDTIYLTSYAKSFTLPNIIYLTNQDGSLINSDVNGMLGLGMPDIDGAYGISVFEEFLNNNVMDTPLYSMCLEPIGDGYLYFSAYGNGSQPFDQDSIVWFEQTYSYMNTLNVPTISFVNKDYAMKDTQVQFTLNTPYLLLEQEIFDEYVKSMTDFLCGAGSDFTMLCENARSLLLEDGSVNMLLRDAEILKKIPPFVLHLKGRGERDFEISIQKMFAVCTNRSSDYFLASIDTEVPICSMIKLNKNHPKSTAIGNIAHTAPGNLYIFDRRRGLLGISHDVICYPKPTSKNMVLVKLPVAYSLIGQIFVILGFCTLLVLSLNKCDEYFYQEEDGDQDEGASLSFLTHNQSRSDITDPNITQNR